MAVIGMFFLIISAVITNSLAEDSIELNIKDKEYILTNGENFLLECASKSPIYWKIPFEHDLNHNFLENNTFNNNIHKASLNIYKASVDFVGFYVCAKNSIKLEPIWNISLLNDLERKEEVKYTYLYADESNYLIVPSSNYIRSEPNNLITIPCRPTSPNVFIKLFHNENEKFFDRRIGFLINVTLNDDKNTYNCTAKKDGIIESKLFIIQIRASSKVLQLQSKMFVSKGIPNTFICLASGIPKPNIRWYFKPSANNDQSMIETTEQIDPSKYIVKTLSKDIVVSNLKIALNESGIITCFAENEMGSSEINNNFYITDSDNGFSVSKTNDLVIVGDTVNLTCSISHYFNKSQVYWYRMPENVEITDDNDEYQLSYQNTQYSTQLILSINHVNKNHTGKYLCKLKESKVKQNILYGTNVIEPSTTLDVKDGIKPIFITSNLNNSEVKYFLGEQNINLSCVANGLPSPILTWYKNNKVFNLTDLDDGRIFFDDDGKRLNFRYFKSEDKGTYACEASNKLGRVHKYITFSINQTNNSLIYIIVLVLFIIFIIVIIVLARKIKKQKETYLDLYKSGFKHFIEGEIEKINPDLSVDEQAELLPYDKKIEFPREKLKIGRQLGSGAFGVVMKAIACGINEKEESTTVAVKMVKKISDPMIIRTLISELKIMIHLGKHLNIISLLGACTTNIQNDDLLVIVEYCQYGNLHHFLLRHRKNFINQIDSQSGNINFNMDSNLIKENISNNNVDSDRNNRTYDRQSSDNILLTTANINSIDRDTSVCDSAQPEWRSNFKGDYNYKKNIRMLSTKDLLSWSYQVASGLDYLSARRILHGDLATRNILLSENNIVKICDFGLAKRMYKAHDYKKKGNTPLPIKWMAIECIRDRIFSTQSDIWAYGIVLWELFTLGSSPYPGMEADENLYKSLVNGYRMKQPEFANKILYDIMLECWRASPLQRPSFKDLVSKFAQLLDNETKLFFAEKYEIYSNMNKNWLLTHRNCDLLTAMSSPDYKSFAFLNPKHDYVNEPYGGSIIVNPSSTDDNDANYNTLNRMSLLNIETLSNNKNKHPITSAEYMEMSAKPSSSVKINEKIEIYEEIQNNGVKMNKNDEMDAEIQNESVEINDNNEIHMEIPNNGIYNNEEYMEIQNDGTKINENNEVYMEIQNNGMEIKENNELYTEIKNDGVEISENYEIYAEIKNNCVENPLYI